MPSVPYASKGLAAGGLLKRKSQDTGNVICGWSPPAQVVSNDLSRGLFPARDLRLLVVDEAHRAQGDYAYCHVVRELTREARMERERNQRCSHCNKLTVALVSSGRR